MCAHSNADVVCYVQVQSVCSQYVQLHGSAWLASSKRGPTQSCAGSRLYMLGNKLPNGEKPCAPTAQRGRRFYVQVQSVTVYSTYA